MRIRPYALAVRFERYFATGDIVVSREGIAASVRDGTLRTYIEQQVLAEEMASSASTDRDQGSTG
jgi:hypothetical protein